MNTKIFKISTFAIIAVLAFSCKKYEPIDKGNFTPMRKANYTIEQLIADFGIDNPNYPTRMDMDGTIKEPFSVNPIDTAISVIIVGRVTSDDYEGNMYKYITIQDLDSAWSLKISIDASNIGAIYPLGCVISIKCNGMALGKYADMYQLGTLYYNPNPDVPRKRGWEVGRMPLPTFAANTQVHSISAPKVDTLTIAEILSIIETDRSLHSRLICIKDVYFTGEEDSMGSVVEITDEADKIFAPSTNGVGFPQSRLITDEWGFDRISISTSEFARFAKVRIPSKEYKGNVTAIVGWYKDRARFDGKAQLTIRSLDDLDLYHKTTGEKWQP